MTIYIPLRFVGYQPNELLNVLVVETLLDGTLARRMAPGLVYITMIPAALGILLGRFSVGLLEGLPQGQHALAGLFKGGSRAREAVG